MNLVRSRALATFVACTSLSLPCDAALFALVDTGQLVRSDDGGVTWSTQATLPVSDAVGLVAPSASSELYLATVRGSVYGSTNSGVDWNVVGGVPASDVVGIAVRPDLALLVLTRSGTLFESLDSGLTFTPLATLGASDLVSLVAGTGVVHALTETGTLPRSADGGATWSVPGGIPTSEAVDVVRLGGAIHVLTASGGVWRSTDEGASWLPIGTLSQVPMSGLVRQGSELVATTREGLVARSTDGTAWQWVGTINQLDVVALATDEPVVTVPNASAPASVLRLAPPSPNPLRGTARRVRLPIDLPRPTTVQAFLYDVAGRLRHVRDPEPLPAGAPQGLDWTLPALPAGVYFVHVVSDAGSGSARLVVLD